MDIKDINTFVEKLAGLRGNDILKTVGLEPRRSTAGKVMPVVGLVGLGVLIGGSVALLFAPRKGEDLRKMIATRFSEMETSVKGQLAAITHRAPTRTESPRKGNNGEVATSQVKDELLRDKRAP